MTQTINGATPVEPIQRQQMRSVDQKGREAIQKLTNKLERLQVEYVPIDSIHPNPYNPNRQSEREFDMLKASICDDGFTQPIIVHKKSKMIVDGEHRWRAMHHLGFKEIAVVFVDMTDAQMRISTLRHNRARGSEDIELSIQVLKDLRELGALDKAVEALQINDIEMQALLEDMPASEIMAVEEFSKPWVPDKTVDAREPERLLADRRISTTEAAQEALQVQDEKRQAKEDAGPVSHLEQREIAYEAAREVVLVTATFEKSESVLVRNTLGSKPAQKLAELCVAAVLAAAPGTYEESIVNSAMALNARYEIHKHK